jgi:retinol dehydrogenase 12
MPSLQAWFLEKFVLFPAVYGAYTELWTGLAPELTTEKNGSYVGPWGRIMTVKKDRLESLKTKEEGGSGKAVTFWEWTEKQCLEYM